jgi:predicted XRE-type DNA-binding protein
MHIGVNKMGFPNRKEIDRVLKELEGVEGTLTLRSDASPREKFRWQLCQKFIRYKRESNITQKMLGELIGVDESKISKILHHRINEFSTDRLIDLYSKLEPELVLSIG